MELQRDVFINTIFEAAKKDKDIIFLTADLGAKALDDFRKELPRQCIHAGISEQNMIDLAAGLSQCGKKVYCYAMAPFATLRCFEQIRVALGAMKQPVCIIGVGVGYGYDDAGPTHYATEDLACMRTIAGMEIYTPGDNNTIAYIAQLTIEKPALRYVRLDRKSLEDICIDPKNLDYDPGMILITGRHLPGGEKRTTLIISCGFMVHTAKKIPDTDVLDVFRIKPLNTEALIEACAEYKHLVTLEEHFLTGGFGSAILEALNDAGVNRRVLRLGAKHHYYFENGGRNHVHELAGIDEKSVHNAIMEFIK